MPGVAFWVVAATAVALVACSGKSSGGPANDRAGAPRAGDAGSSAMTGSGAGGRLDGAASGSGGMPGGAGGTDASGSGGTAGGAGSGGGGTTSLGLGMNDVTILAPLPADVATPVLLRGADLADDGTAMVPLALFDRVARDEGGKEILLPAFYDGLQLVAVRFDLCDRKLPGVCPEAEDARLRLVFQPLGVSSLPHDVGVHAFYAIANPEIGEALAALRELAAMTSAGAQQGPLRISPALSEGDDVGAYATKLRAFVTRYGGESRLVRLTINAQPLTTEQVRWILRGLEKRGDTFADITMLGGTGVSQTVIFAGTASYDVTPLADTPPGLAGVIKGSTFYAADADTRRSYLAALAAVDNPLTHSAETVPCVACHVSTAVMHARASTQAIDPLTLPGRYTSELDLSTPSSESADGRTLRALGYQGQEALISQRVVNETAQVLAEIAARYP